MGKANVHELESTSGLGPGDTGLERLSVLLYECCEKEGTIPIQKLFSAREHLNLLLFQLLTAAS